MGSFRRQLTLLLCLIGTPAVAQVCDSRRPGWSPADGPATAFGELLQFMIWGGGAVLIIALVAGLYFRKSIILNAVLLVALIMAVPYLWPLDPSTHELAMAEGCIGRPTLVLGALGAIWVAAVAGTLFRRKARP